MLYRRFATILMALAVTLGTAQYASAQMTLWKFLGIPQAAKRINGGLVNRRGNFPGLERKPPVLPLADPANLESPIEAIKVAAEIKMDEDLAKQKIKAVKYLAKKACGCPNDKRDGAVTDALIGMMEDCSEKVRMATVKAIEASAADEECCGGCNKDCCCDEKIVMMLAEMAWEKDDNGCWIEPSEEVREAAKEAACACCPGRGPGPNAIYEAEAEGETKPDTKPMGEKDENVKPKGEGSTTEAQMLNDALRIVRQHQQERGTSRRSSRRRYGRVASIQRSSVRQRQAQPARRVAVPQRIAAKAVRPQVSPQQLAAPVVSPLAPSVASRTPASKPASSRRTYRGGAAAPAATAATGQQLSSFINTGTGQKAAPRTSARQPAAPAVKSPGSAGATIYVDRARGIAQVRTSSTGPLSVGSILKVYQKREYGFRLLGEMEVFEAGQGVANVRPLNGFDLSLIGRGTVVVRGDRSTRTKPTT